MHKLALFFVTSAALLGGSAARAAEETDLSARLSALLARSLPRMACNLSSAKEKPVVRMVNGKEVNVLLKPAAGSIVASPNFDDPDYYFHWNRDSAIVVRTLIQFLPAAPAPAAEKIRAFLADFVRFSGALQASETPYGLGETRFNVDGSIDDLPWGRPQHDGPALRALALLDLLALGESAADEETRAQAKDILKADLDHLSYAFEAKSYDIWEFRFGHHFFTRLVQLAALERGAKEAPGLARREWGKAAGELRRALARHWDEQGAYYRYGQGQVTDGEGADIGKVEDGRDASVILAMEYAGLAGGAFSLTDPRMLSTAKNLEDFFRGEYRFNRDHQFAPAIGRFPGDDYYDGNPWYVLTSAYAELYFRLAKEFSEGEMPFLVKQENRAFFEAALGRKLKLGQNLRAPAVADELAAAFSAKGDGFLATMMETINRDGMMPEQFSKDDGRAVSAADLTWSYAAFLSAVLARGGVDLSSVNFHCER